MARNDYISDNLVNIRERLKENAAKTAPGTKTPEEAGSPAAEAPARLSERTQPRPASNRADDLERLRRDLEGRLERDRAAVGAELEQLQRKGAELETFRRALEALRADFDRLGNPGSVEYIRALESLRIAYFQAAGRASAFLRGRESAGRSVAAGESKTFRRLFIETLPLSAALVAGSLIVSITLIVLFG